MEKLDELKALAKEYTQRPEIKARAEELRRLLRGENSNSGWPSIGRGGGSGDDGGDSGGGDEPPLPPAGDGVSGGLIR